MSKRIAFFPYHPDLEVIVDYVDKLQGYEIVGVISYLEDYTKVRSLNAKLGVRAEGEILRNCDIVILLENYRGFIEDKYYSIIEEAIVLGVEIVVMPVVCGQLDMSKYEGMYSILQNSFRVMSDYEKYIYARREMRKDAILNDIDVPVITIMGMGKSCGKFETTLLTKATLEKDYNIVSVSSNALSTLFGGYTYPCAFYADISFETKVKMLNYYIRELVVACNPDAVLLCVPEGIAPFEGNESNHFAEYALVITSAVPVDLTVFCTYYFEDGFKSNGFNEIAKIIYSKFGCYVGAIAMAKTMFDMKDGQEKEIIYEYLHDDYLINHYPDFQDNNVMFINLNNKKVSEERLRKCIKRLENNVTTL